MRNFLNQFFEVQAQKSFLAITIVNEISAPKNIK